MVRTLAPHPEKTLAACFAGPCYLNQSIDSVYMAKLSSPRHWCVLIPDNALCDLLDVSDAHNSAGSLVQADLPNVNKCDDSSFRTRYYLDQTSIESTRHSKCGVLRHSSIFASNHDHQICLKTMPARNSRFHQAFLSPTADWPAPVNKPKWDQISKLATQSNHGQSRHRWT